MDPSRPSVWRISSIGRYQGKVNTESAFVGLDIAKNVFRIHSV